MLCYISRLRISQYSTQNLSTGMHYIPVLALYRGDMQRRGSLVRSSISRASPDEWCATVAQIVELPHRTSVATIEANIALRLAPLCALRLSDEINGYRIAQLWWTTISCRPKSRYKITGVITDLAP